MEFIKKGKLYKKLKGKRHVELADLLQIIEEEFKVCLYVKCDELEIDDHSYIQAINPNRKPAHSYSNDEGLHFLCEIKKPHH